MEARETLDRERHLAALRFVVDEGPQVRIGRIVVTGNRRTRESVVRGALSVSEGDVYDPAQIARSQAALLRLGVFRSVGLRVQDPEVPQETKDLAVECAFRGESGVIGHDEEDGDRLKAIAFPRIAGGKAFDVTQPWFVDLLSDIGQTSVAAS